MANIAHTRAKWNRKMATKLYLTPSGYTETRPANYPALDRSAVMQHAHRLAAKARHLFPNYRAALSYGLRNAWLAAHNAREAQSLRRQSTNTLTITIKDRHRWGSVVAGI